MISTNQFKNGIHIEVDGDVFRIVEFQHVKPGKGGAFVRTKLKNISSGAVLDKTFRAGEKFRSVHTESRKMQYSYESGDEAIFMDSKSFDQVPIAKGPIEEALNWIMPNDEIEILYVDGRPAGVQVPSAVELKVVEADPGVKGDTASGGGYKPCTMETGVVIQAPLFVEKGDRLRIDTRTREYIQRV